MEPAGHNTDAEKNSAGIKSPLLRPKREAQGPTWAHQGSSGKAPSSTVEEDLRQERSTEGAAAKPLFRSGNIAGQRHIETWGLGQEGETTSGGWVDVWKATKMAPNGVW